MQTDGARAAIHGGNPGAADAADALAIACVMCRRRQARLRDGLPGASRFRREVCVAPLAATHARNERDYLFAIESTR